jgi:hypothetical protein
MAGESFFFFWKWGWVWEKGLVGIVWGWGGWKKMGDWWAPFYTGFPAEVVDKHVELTFCIVVMRGAMALNTKRHSSNEKRMWLTKHEYT